MLTRTFVRALRKPQYVRAFSQEIAQAEGDAPTLTPEEEFNLSQAKFGADMTFSAEKHSYILSFPWGTSDVVDKKFNKIDSGFWHTFINNREMMIDFNQRFREFHQACAIPDYEWMNTFVESRLQSYLENSIGQISYHGLDLQMANLTVDQPKIDILDVELTHGLPLDTKDRLPREEYDVVEGSFMGAKCTTYTEKGGKKHSLLDNFDTSYKPYVMTTTALIHSPMKLFVYNQNRTSVLFGNQETDLATNIVKFAVPLRLNEFKSVLPIPNKPRLIDDMRITDFNNVMG